MYSYAITSLPANFISDALRSFSICLNKQRNHYRQRCVNNKSLYIIVSHTYKDIQEEEFKILKLGQFS